MSDDDRNGIAIDVEYEVTDGRRVLRLSRGDRSAVLVQDVTGYSMISVARATNGPELERYYGFDMAIDHAAELLEVTPSVIPIPEEARSMGM